MTQMQAALIDTVGNWAAVAQMVICVGMMTGMTFEMVKRQLRQIARRRRKKPMEPWAA